MIYLGQAGTEEVVAATPADPKTIERTEGAAPYGIWSLDAEDIGDVGCQLPDGTMGAVRHMYKRWMSEWIDHDPTSRHATTHQRLLAALRERGRFDVRPIVLDAGRQIHDGKHRIFAAFEYTETAPGFLLEVFWNRTS